MGEYKKLIKICDIELEWVFVVLFIKNVEEVLIVEKLYKVFLKMWFLGLV